MSKKLKGPIETIQVGPKTWAECLPLLLALLECGNTKGKAYAREELKRMAQAADIAYANESKT